MTSLLTRLESLTAPSREVSDELLLSWGWHTKVVRDYITGTETLWFPPGEDSTGRTSRPHPTGSIDDALLGVPEEKRARVLMDSMPRAIVTDKSIPISVCIEIVKARGGV